MKTINNIRLIFFILIGLVFTNNSYAWSTRDFGNDGPHPELLSQSTCLYDANNYYQSGPYSESHSYTGKMGGFDVWGRGSGGANTGLGIGGTGFYETGNVKYFVGRFAEYVVIREGGGREAQNIPYYKYQICYVNSASLSYYGYENSTSACPATQPNGAIFIQRRYEVWTDGSVRNYTDWYETSRTCTAVLSYYGYENSSQACPATQPNGAIYIQRRYEVWTDGTVRNYTGWYETSRTCSPVFSYYGYNGSTSTCPSTQPSGVINIQQRYEVWTDGSVRNYTGWYEVSRTCVAVYQSIEVAYQALPCATYGGIYTEGGNGISQQRSRAIWSDGAKDWSAWTTTSNTCYRTVSEKQAQQTYACAEGQIGKLVKEPRRTYIDYASDASKTQAEKDILKEKNATAWVEYTVSNTCTNIPDKTWTEEGTRSVTCESLLGSGYTGMATQAGTYSYTYSSVTKKTTSSFVAKSNDTSACSRTVNDLLMETRTISCPTGQNGTITQYRYVSTDSTGAKSYPQGEAYQVLNSNCNTDNMADNDNSNYVDNTQRTDLLSNTTLNANNLNSIKIFRQYIESLSSTDLKSENYKLNLVFEDMGKGKYNSQEIASLVTQYKKKVSGKTDIAINVAFPKTLDKYIGYNDLTTSSIKNSYIDTIEINSNMNLNITYKTINTKTGKNDQKVLTVPFLNGSGLKVSDFNSL